MSSTLSSPPAPAERFKGVLINAIAVSCLRGLAGSWQNGSCARLPRPSSVSSHLIPGESLAQSSTNESIRHGGSGKLSRQQTKLVKRSAR